MQSLFFSILSISLVIVPFTAFSQSKSAEKPYETIYNSTDFESYFVYGGGLSWHRVDNEDQALVDATAGWIFNNSFMLGASASFSISTRNSAARQLELWADKLINPNKAIHPVLGLSTGYTQVHNYYERFSGEQNILYLSVNPTLGFQMNMSENMRVDIRAGYNMVVKRFGYTGLQSNRVSSPTISVRILFGKFAEFSGRE